MARETRIMSIARLLGISILFVGLSVGTVAEATQATIASGVIKGVAQDSVHAFKGIPYAAPPVGENRWKVPQPVASWDGVRDCTEFGPACPQTPYPEMSVYYREPEPMSEDCLYLNVWTPEMEPEEPLPVMVWIHGGALTRGSGAIDAYDGTNFAKKGVVLVTINYRLNVFGFFAHPALSTESEQGVSGNYGVLDQVAALEWVQKNIEQFGGDPDRVTIFGESAGSWSVCYLQATPHAKGLFHRAIGQSGGAFGASLPLRSDDPDDSNSAEAGGVAFASKLDVEGTGSDALKALRAIPTDDLVKQAFRGSNPGIRPCVDGWTLPKSVYEIFSAGEHNRVPVIVGSNADEGTSLAGHMVPKSKDIFLKGVEANYGAAKDAFLSVYPVETDADAAAAFLSSYRDSAFSWQMRTWARLSSAAGDPAYLYHFSHVPKTANHEFYGAYHAAEIVYVFGNTHILGADGRPEDEAMAEAMQQYLIHFAATGDPNGGKLPTWPRYDKGTGQHMEFGEKVAPGSDLYGPALDFFDEVNAYRRASGR